MPRTELVEDRFAPTEAPPVNPQPVDMASVQAAMVNPIMLLGSPGYLGPKSEVEKELDLIAAAVRLFHMKPADLVMRECSAYTARLTEMAVLLHRIEGESRQWTRVRTQQVQRFLDELDRQWRTASRLIEVNRQDLEVLRGQM